MLVKDNNAPPKVPSKKETLENLRLQREDLITKDRFKNQDQLTDSKRAGMGIPFYEIVKIVKGLNPNIWTEEAKNNPGHIGFYRMNNETRKPEFLTACEMTILPEFTVLHKDDKGLPNRADRGWREVLVMLLSKKAITKQQILRFFAEPSNNPRSEGWFKKTQGVN